MARSLVDQDEQELASELFWEVASPEKATRIAEIIRNMIEHSLLEHGLSNEVDHG
jgi:hypothetical protein